MIVNTTTGRLAPVQSIRRANPNVSIPSSPDDATLAMLGYARIQPTTQPEGDVVTEGQPEQRDGAWYQTWEVREFTVEELAEREQQQREQLAQQIADRRWQAETGGITLNGMQEVCLITTTSQELSLGK